jgi:hypothetical protein
MLGLGHLVDDEFPVNVDLAVPYAGEADTDRTPTRPD